MTRTGLDDAAYARIRALENNYGSPVGIRVFDMRHIIKVPQRRENETLGYSYILPQAGVPREDRRRAHFRWKINQATGLLGPTAVALGAWRATDVPSIQGALMNGGRIGLSSSYSSAPGLWASGRGQSPGVRRDGGRPRPVATGLRPRGGSHRSRWPPRCARTRPRPS